MGSVQCQKDSDVAGEKACSGGRGNFYGERYTNRQFQIAIDQILAREVTRSRICENLSERGKPVRVIAGELGMPADAVLRHIVELRRRGLVILDHIEDGKTPYYRYATPGGTS